ncbi:endonuclease V [Rhabdothermincola sp.]|uniref:endonuclease V n=1 Tax=Rhabdothermincola sp. TaxID=2820405 RepID=UPI002FE09AD2
MDHDPREDWREDRTLVAVQERLGGAEPAPWQPEPGRPLIAAGCFVAFARGEQGPGHAGDHAWCAAVLVDEHGRLRSGVVVPGLAGASYAPGMLARREGSMLLDALEALDGRPEVLLVDATGRDHPRRAGLALHLGAATDLPSVGVTHRPLVATGAEPVDPAVGATAPLFFDGEEVARWVRTRPGVKPLVAHAAWRTSVDVAVEVVLRTTGTARTPEPLRRARCLAREARSEGLDHPVEQTFV